MGPFVPPGSYQQTSNTITSTLYCQARKRNGQTINAGLDLTNLATADIANMDGFLVNNTGGGSGPGNNYVPGGSYAQTSSGMQVILAAQAQKIDQSWQWSTLDITNLAPGQTISNIDGVLTVD